MKHKHSPNCLAPATHEGPCNSRWWCPACGHLTPVMPRLGLHSHVDASWNEYTVAVVLVAEDERGEQYEVGAR